MFNPPKTRAEAEARRYGQWAGNPNGYRFKPSRCACEVSSKYLLVQCSRKPGHGPDELYCKQHAKKVRHV